MSAASTINHEGTDQPLPVEVRERPTAHTSIYKAGQLVYAGVETEPSLVPRHKLLKVSFRLQSAAFMLTHNSRSFTLDSWPES